MTDEDSIKQIVDNAEHIVIIQADNPDGDSLASALALEHILSEQGKAVHLYCGAEIPSYLRHLDGWDRVQNELPIRFDASIIVDTSALILLEQLQKTGALQWVKAKPCIILDHHTATESTIDFAQASYIKEAVATGELIYELSQKLGWKRNQEANKLLASSILSDSLGLTTDGTSSRSIHIMAELVEQGVSIPAIEAARRAMHKKSPQLVHYKAQLMSRIEYHADQRIATVDIPWEEIEKYSPEYNPSVLVQDEMRMVTGVAIAIAFKTYPNGRITAKLRANYGYAICADLAKQFGGGGHPYAAGFKIENGKPFNEVKSECIRIATELLDTLKQDTHDDKTTQYTYSVS